MRILIIGFIAFLVWSSFSTYLYVCNIKGLCDGPVTLPYAQPFHEKTIAIDTPIIMEPTKIQAIPEPEIVYFDFDKSEIKTVEIIEQYILKSNAYFAQNTNAKLKLIGYTDAIGTTEYNKKLGYNRAESVKCYFESKGIPKSKIIIESKGETLPVDDNTTIAGRKENRRTEITIKN